jgi:hypothetical protein
MRELAVENDLGELSLKFFMEEGDLVQNILDLVSKENIGLPYLLHKIINFRAINFFSKILTKFR